MLHRISGIVLRTTRYTDNSSIVRMYTDCFGMQTYMVKGIHGRLSKVKANYFSNLTLLEMIATKTDKQRLESIKEITSAYSYTVDFDPVKNSIYFFLNELINKTIQEGEADQGLFDYFRHAFEVLKWKEEKAVNFHLAFMLQYSRYLGFYPSENYTKENMYFDLQEGFFISEYPKHNHFLDARLSKHIFDLMSTHLNECERVKISNSERKVLLLSLIDYYKLHRFLISDLISLSVLEQV